MRGPVILAAIVWLGAAPVMAADFSQPLNRHQHRDFWLDGSGRPLEHGSRPRSAFTLTYTDGLAARLGVGGENSDLFSRRLGAAAVAPTLAGTFTGGHPALVLRWQTGQ